MTKTLSERLEESAQYVALFEVSDDKSEELAKLLDEAAALARRVEGAEEYPEAAEVCGEAYQVVGSLLDDLGVFNTPEAEKVLDNLSHHRMVHSDVLPWPSFRAAPPSTEGGEG
jgi:hypothetical protein